MCGGGGGSGGGGGGSSSRGGNRSNRGGLESLKSRGSSSSRGNSNRDGNRGNRSSQRAGGIASVGASISRATSSRGSRGNSQRDGNRNRNTIASQLAARNKANRNERNHSSWGRGSSSRGNSQRDGNRGNRNRSGPVRSGFGGFGGTGLQFGRGTRRGFGGYPSFARGARSSVPNRHSLGNGPAYGTTAGGEFGGGNPFAEEEEFNNTATQVGGFLASAVNPVVGSAVNLVGDAGKGRIDLSNVAGLAGAMLGPTPVGLPLIAGAAMVQALKAAGVVPDDFGTVSGKGGAGKGQPFVDPNSQNDGAIVRKPAQGLGYLSNLRVGHDTAPKAPTVPKAPQQKDAQKPQGLGLGVTMGRSRNRGPRNLGPLAFLRPRYGRVR